MTAPGSAFEDVLDALTAAWTAALSVHVHNGRPTSQAPERAYVVVGATALDGQSDAGNVDVAYSGMMGTGQTARAETVTVHCLAVYRAPSEVKARKGAMALVTAAAAALSDAPKLGLGNVYNALVSRTDATQIYPGTGGPTVVVIFDVTAKARLV